MSASIGFGWTNPWPFTFGDDECVEQVELDAMLDDLKAAYSPEEGTGTYAELEAYACLLAGVWAINERGRNQSIPKRMCEALPDWEETLRTIPGPTSTDVNRRAAVAAKMIGIARNAIIDIRAAIVALMGSNFEDLVFAVPADEKTYWPGINPGPPGFEWCSNRCILGVRVNQVGLTNEAFADKRSQLADLLDTMLPAWMTYEIGTGTGFIVGQGIVGQTFL